MWIGGAIFADVIQGTDMGMRKGRKSPRLTLEAHLQFGAARQLRMENLYRDEPIQARVSRPVNFTHSACTESGPDLVRPEFRAGGERHWWAPF
jgi:hypothetical protein